MGPFIMAWAIAEGIVIYRTIKRPEKGQSAVEAKAVFIPPSPAELLFSSGVFIMLAIMAEWRQGRPLALTLAVGFDIAAFLGLFDKVPGQNIPRGPWPPAIAPPNVIIPDGGWSKGQGRTLDDNSGGSKPPTTPTPPRGPKLRVV